jgi:hypothetical protein
MVQGEESAVQDRQYQFGNNKTEPPPDLVTTAHPHLATNMPPSS